MNFPDCGSTPRRMPFVADVAIGTVCFVVLMATSPLLPLVWDEPNAILRAEKLGTWLELWFHRTPQQAPPWTAESIRQFCPYTTVIEGHPALYGFMIAVGRLLSVRWLPSTESYRFGPILLFAVAATALFRRLRHPYGMAPALLSVAALMTMPRVFAHAHFASIDGPLTSCWILAWASFDAARRSRVGCIVWGVLLGMTMSCKFTGWLAIVGFVAWSALYRDRVALRTCAVGSIVGILTFVDLNPRLWDNPLVGMWQFFALNTGRAKLGLNIPTLFFGERYDLTHPAPWYNSLAWTALTVPLGTVLVAGLGAMRAIRHWRQEPLGVLIVIHWALLVVVKALPFAPPHDAERLFLPSFAFLAGLAGLGCQSILEAGRRATGWLSRPVRLSKLGPFALCLMLTTAAAETVWYSPQWLCYYSPVVGGVSGAARCGLEPTYYWDGLDRDVIQWLDSRTEDETLVYCPSSREYAVVMARDPQLRLRFSASDPANCDWYLIQHRPSFWSALDRTLLKSETPRFIKTIRDPVWGCGPWRLDVPIVYVFSREQVLRAERSAASSD